MTVLDYAVLIVIGLSTLLGAIRGLVREVMALLTWIVALAVAYLFSSKAAALMQEAIPSEELRVAIVFAALFIGVLLVMSLVAALVSRWAEGVGLGVEDRVLGSFFGLARGGLIVMALVLFAGLTSLPRQPVWRNAMFGAPLAAAAVYVKGWLPDEWSRRIRYD
jgi:membrane protein required for colicin V production